MKHGETPRGTEVRRYLLHSINGQLHHYAASNRPISGGWRRPWNPMNQQAEDLLMGAPSEVTPKQLKELHIKLDLPKAKT